MDEEGERERERCVWKIYHKSNSEEKGHVKKLWRLPTDQSAWTHKPVIAYEYG